MRDMAIDRVIAEVTSEAGDVHWLVHISAGRHDFLADASEQEGGGANAPEPYAYVLAGLAACTSGTLRMYAEDHFMTLHYVAVDARMVHGAGGIPAIERDIRLVGNLDEDDRKKLAQVAERTPVTKALRAGLPIRTRM
jgi:putative redox protein